MTPLSLFHCLTGGVLLFCGALTSYTTPGKADFDTALQLLNPYGTWSKINNTWAYTPLNHEAPYSHGRWLYTEYGWCWKGASPESWATEHYGYWKKTKDVWSWYPGPFWLPEIVEFRSTSTHIGWRCAAVNEQGEFIEKPEERYLKTDEWRFVTYAQFANPITPGESTQGTATRQLLEDSADCRHTYVTYREIDRPGPHPADFLTLCRDGGMFAPQTMKDTLAMQAAAARPVIPASILSKNPLANPPPKSADSSSVPTGLVSPAPSTPVPSGLAGTTAPNNAPITNQAQTQAAADAEDASNRRQVKYWVTMSLPTYWTPRPLDAEPTQTFLYRPDFYQDADGINRRITLWFDPNARIHSTMSLHDLLAGTSAPAPAKTSAVVDAPPGTPALPAVPAETPASPAADLKPSNPFRSPYDVSSRPAPRAAPVDTNAAPVAPVHP